MEDDIREIVHATTNSRRRENPSLPRRGRVSNPFPGVVSPQSTSKSTSAVEKMKKKTKAHRNANTEKDCEPATVIVATKKQNKEKKKIASSDRSKATAKSTMTGKQKRSRDSRRPRRSSTPTQKGEHPQSGRKDPTKITLSIPDKDGKTTKSNSKAILPKQRQETVESPKKGKKPMLASGKKKPSSEKRAKSASRLSEKEEPKKRRERMMVSPFEYLQILNKPTHQRDPLSSSATPSQDDNSLFADDVSHLTLPKPLRDLEKQRLAELAANGNSPLKKDIEVTVSASLLDDVPSPLVDSPTPGWSRKDASLEKSLLEGLAITDAESKKSIKSIDATKLVTNRVKKTTTMTTSKKKKAVERNSKQDGNKIKLENQNPKAKQHEHQKPSDDVIEESEHLMDSMDIKRPSNVRILTSLETQSDVLINCDETRLYKVQEENLGTARSKNVSIESTNSFHDEDIEMGIKCKPHSPSSGRCSESFRTVSTDKTISNSNDDGIEKSMMTSSKDVDSISYDVLMRQYHQNRLYWCIGIATCMLFMTILTTTVTIVLGRKL